MRPFNISKERINNYRAEHNVGLLDARRKVIKEERLNWLSEIERKGSLKELIELVKDMVEHGVD